MQQKVVTVPARSVSPCRNPVVTKDGFLFDKEAILQYIITKKNEHSRKLKEYERLRRNEDAEVTEQLERKQQENVDKFVNAAKPVAGANNGALVFSGPSTSHAAVNGLVSTNTSDSISNMANGHAKKLPSFWLPSECPNAALAKAKKPDSTIYCPVSMQPLKVKDLVDVKFTLLNDGDEKRSLIAREARYMCPVTHDVLGNAVPCAVLRPTGDVVTLECVEKLIKKDMLHPLTNQKLREKDIIPLQRGGTGYATTNDKLEAQEKRPMLQV